MRDLCRYSAAISLKGGFDFNVRNFYTSHQGYGHQGYCLVFKYFYSQSSLINSLIKRGKPVPISLAFDMGLRVEAARLSLLVAQAASQALNLIHSWPTGSLQRKPA